MLLKLPMDEPLNATDPTLWIPLFNKALVHFNLRQPKTALKILLPLMIHLKEMGKTKLIHSLNSSQIN